MLFCDDIKRHIVSFLGAKPMKTIDMFAVRDLIMRWLETDDCLAEHKILTYRLRKRISYEQFQFELSDVGHQSRKKYIQKWVVHFNRKQVLDELVQYHKNEEEVVIVPDSFPDFAWISSLFNIYFIEKKQHLSFFLDDIRDAGAISTKKHLGRERVVAHVAECL